MEEIIDIHGFKRQIPSVEEIRADVCDTLTELCYRWVDDDGNCWNTDCPFNDDVCKVMQLKEQK